MKILCVSPSYWPAYEFGGPIQSLHFLNKGLIDNGADISVFTTNKGQATEITINKKLKIDGIEVTYYPYTKYLEFLGTTGWHFSYPLLKALKNELRQYNLVYILSIWNFTTAITAYYCKKYNIPYVISPRGQLYDQVTTKKSWKKAPYYKLIASRILKNADAIHYTSDHEYLNVHNRLGLKNEAIVIPNGIVLEEYEDLPEKGKFIKLFPHLKNKQVLLYLGRLSWKKGIDLIIKSMPTILEKNKNAHLVIAGNDEDNCKTGLIKIIESLDLKYFDKDSNTSTDKDTKITFTGYLNNIDKKKAMVDSKLFLLSSHSENFGMTVIEAIACELPILISNNVGIADKVIEYNAGVVFANNKNEITDNVSNILKNEKQSDLFRINARKLLRDQYEINKISKIMLFSFKRLLNQNG